MKEIIMSLQDQHELFQGIIQKYLNNEIRRIFFPSLEINKETNFYEITLFCNNFDNKEEIVDKLKSLKRLYPMIKVREENKKIIIYLNPKQVKSRIKAP